MRTRFGLKLPETEEMDLKDKTNRLMDIMVFIHEKDKFTFYRFFHICNIYIVRY